MDQVAPDPVRPAAAWCRPAAAPAAVTNGASVTGTVVFATGALPLGVAIGTVPEPFAAPHADAIADLAHQTTVAVGGAGASAALATRTGAHLLDQDPVSAAETRDRALPRSASPGPA